MVGLPQILLTEAKVPRGDRERGPDLPSYGISRQVFYVWYRRYEAEGPAGLRDRSTRPAHFPHETPAEVVEKIIYLRQKTTATTTPE
jgi:hypothetical protein